MDIYLNQGLNAFSMCIKMQSQKHIKLMHFYSDPTGAISESFSPAFKSFKVFYYFPLSTAVRQIFILHDNAVLPVTLN